MARLREQAECLEKQKTQIFGKRNGGKSFEPNKGGESTSSGDALYEKLDEVSKELDSDLKWFENAMKKVKTSTTAWNNDDDDDKDELEAPSTPSKSPQRGGGSGKSTKSPSTPPSPIEKKKRSGDGGTVKNSPDAKKSPHKDVHIFDLPGNGALTLEELSAGGHAFGKFPDGSAGVDEPPRGVRIGGTWINDANVNARLLEVSLLKTPRDVRDDDWELSSARMKRKVKKMHEKSATSIPSSYPKQSIPVLEDAELFKRLDADALFWTFYYNGDPKRAALAAQELIRSNWRLHKSYNTWFARLGAPTQIVEDERYEVGDVIYFDHSMHVDAANSSSGWCQRTKSGFKSRYDDFL
jgi:CCR4-NOT transcription complex subunit 3